MITDTVAARLIELAHDTEPITDAGLVTAGAFPGAHEDTRELFSQIRVEAVVALATHVAAFEVPAEDLIETASGYDLSCRAYDLAEASAARHALARDYATVADDPVRAIVEADRDFGAATPTTVRFLLATGYAEAAAETYLRGDLGGDAVIVAEQAHRRVEGGDRGEIDCAVRDALQRHALSLDDAELYDTWSEVGSTGDEAEALVRRVFIEHAASVATEAMITAARAVSGAAGE